MFDVFGSVKGLIKLDSVNIDNNIFRLHYKATVIILIAFSLLVTSRQYIGDPIDCVSDKIPGGYLDTYCWIHATFTIPDRMNGSGVIHPGVSVKREGDTLKYHKYYQWVCFVLFFQAMFFYFPRYLWKNLEAGKMESLVLDLTNPIIDESTKRDRKKLLVDYFTTNMHNHNSYAVRFFLCEVLNFVNVIVQIYFVDTFLGGEFTTYGSDVLRLSQLEPKDRIDPMAKVFPKVTKCTFKQFGYSGTTEVIDTLCVLPLNIVNEKIYIFLWFWFIILAVVTGLALLYRLVILLTPQVRSFLLRSRASMAPIYEVDVVSNKCQIGDWFVLLLLGKNIDPLVYKELICDLASKFQGRKAVEP